MHAVIGVAGGARPCATRTGVGSLVEVDAVRRRARARVRADHRVDARTACCSSGTGTAARSPRRRASTAPDDDGRAGSRLSVDDRRAVAGARRRSIGRPDLADRPGARATSPAAGAAHDRLDEALGAWAADARRRRRGRPARSPPGSRPRPRSTPPRRPAPAVRRPRLPRDRRPPGDRPAAAARPCRSGSPASTAGPGRPAPCFGQHTDEVLTELLGLSAAELADLAGRRRVIADHPVGLLIRSIRCTDLFDRFAVIDVDTHLTEPPDVWTARMPAALHDAGAAHRARRRHATCGWPTANCIGAPGYYSMAGFDGVMPAIDARRPTTTSPPSMYDADARASQFLDERGHPRPGALPERRRLRERLLPARSATASSSLALRAGLQRLPHRLVQRRPRPAASRSPRCRSGTSTSPIAELQRCVAQRPPGGELLQPARRTTASRRSRTAHWDPIWAAAQEAGVSVSFHVGGGSMGTQFERHRRAWAG